MKKVQGVWLPDNDTHFEKHLYKGPTFCGKGTYQFEKLMSAIELVPSRQVALDIGAHVGLWSMVLQKYFMQVVAFEPVPEHLHCFHANVQMDNVKIFSDALGNSERRVFINPTPDNTGNAHVETVKFEDTDLIEVQQRRLDDYVFDGPISFIKIDVEGYELEVIEGGRKTILEHKPVIVVEQKPGNAKKYGFKDNAAVTLLMRWGAKLQWNKNGDYCLKF